MFADYTELIFCSLTMFRLNTIITVFRIENVNLSDLNQYLFEIDWSINRQGNWLSIQYNINNFLYFIDDDCSCVIKIFDLESFDKKFNIFLERNLNRYRWQNRRRKSCFRIEKFICLLIDFYQIYQFADAIFIFFSNLKHSVLVKYRWCRSWQS